MPVQRLHQFFAQFSNLLDVCLCRDLLSDFTLRSLRFQCDFQAWATHRRHNLLRKKGTIPERRIYSDASRFSTKAKRQQRQKALDSRLQDAFLFERSSSALIGTALLCSDLFPLFRNSSASCRYLACSECGGKNERSSFCGFR